MVVFATPEAAASPPPLGPSSVLEQAGVVGDPPPTVEPIAAGNWWLLAGLLALTVASLWTVRRFKLLRPRPDATRRLDAMDAATRPSSDGRPPINLGLILILSAIGVWIVSAVFASIPYTLAGGGEGRPEPSLSLSAQMSGAMNGSAILLIGIGCILWAPLRATLGLPSGIRSLAGDLKLGAVAFGLALPPVLFIALAVGLTMQLLAIAGLIPPPDTIAHVTLRELTSSERTGAWWAVIAMVVIAAPIAEELIYRGLLQTGLRANLGASAERRTARLDWFAIAFASVLFTIVHLGAAAPHALIVLFALSVAMGLAYERTGRILVPILMHIGFNALNILISQFA